MNGFRSTLFFAVVAVLLGVTSIDAQCVNCEARSMAGFIQPARTIYQSAPVVTYESQPTVSYEPVVTYESVPVVTTTTVVQDSHAMHDPRRVRAFSFRCLATALDAYVNCAQAKRTARRSRRAARLARS